MDNKIYDIALKLSSGKALNADEELQMQAIHADADQNAMFEELSFVFKQTKLEPISLDINVETEWNRFKLNRARGKKRKVIRLITKWSSAAVIALLVGILFFNQKANKPVVFATQSEVLEFTLPDNSIVSLNKFSELRLHKQFNKTNRTVDLNGEGFFDVSHNADIPFNIELVNGTKVQVLGTKFNLRSYAKDIVTDLQVIEGKVAFGFINKSPELIVEKGNKAQFNTKEEEFSSVTKVNYHINNWQDGQFKFDNTPMAEMVESFERYFNKRIIYPKNEGSLHYSGQFNKPKESDFAKIISLAFGWNYQITDSQIVFSSKK